MIRRRGRLAQIGAIVLVVCTSHSARAGTGAADDLSAALNTLARRANIELIFDSAQLAGIRAPVVAGMTPTATLDLLLAGTRFTYRQADPRTFVIVSRATAPTGEQPPPSAGPEIVVTGRLSQNVDLVRGRDEIQPYWTASGQDIDASGATTADDFLRTQLPVNRDVAPLSQQGASPRSEIDLRGLGSAQTLVLIDGRRMADVPVAAGLFAQSDINGIPVEAIDRIEVLAAAAGGIFGIGATGGAVNIVLKRAYDGVLLSATNGITGQGDGITHTLYGRLGWQTRDGRTKVMVSGSWAHDGGVLTGDRPFAEAARLRRLGTDAATFPVVSGSLNIQSASGAPLVFTSAYGGAALGAAQTYMALGISALGAAGIATLTAHAGAQDLSLSPDAQGAESSLVARTQRSSVMANVRQAIGDSTDLFLDYMRLDDRGYAQAASLATANLYVPAGSAGNPFTQAIYVSFPNAAAPALDSEDDLSQRASLGLIRHFAGGWSLESDVAYSTATVTTASSDLSVETTPEVFAGSAVLDADLAAAVASTDAATSTDHLIDGNVRLVGPLARLPGGQATITATGEFRREWSAGYIEALTYDTSTIRGVSVPHAEDVWSAFGEARLPILPAQGPARPWRGLAAQLAVRLDRYALEVPAAGLDEAIDNRATVLATTAGLQSRPLDGLMLRASVSTAAMPPTPSQLAASAFTAPDIYADPERGGAFQPSGRPNDIDVTEGSTTLRPQETTTLTAGMVLEPQAMPGLRLSVDYTRLSTRHEIVAFVPGDIAYFIANAALYPGRVQRAALTAADIAAGYSGGAVTGVDISPLQTGSSHLQTLDVALGETLPLGGGRLHLQADADWVMSYWRYGGPLAGSYDLVGDADGPLAWRANLGADWSDTHWSIGVAAQLYAGYWLKDGTPLTGTQIAEIVDYGIPLATVLADQASEPHVPVQGYIDLSIAFRPQGPRGLQIRLTIDNLFDHQPPIVANTLPYPASAYTDVTPASGVAHDGDVLGRRFALNLRVPFGR